LVVAPEVAAPAPLSTVRPASDVAARALLTAGAAVAVLILLRFPVLGAPRSVIGGGGAQVDLRLLNFGLTPFISAFIVVELIALVIPPLRAMRVGSGEERATLNRVAMVLGGLLVVAQIAGVAQYSASSTAIALPPPELLWPQLLAAHAVVLALAVAVTRNGLGHGFALVLGVTALNHVYEAVTKVTGNRYGAEPTAGDWVLSAAVMLAAVGVAVRLARAARGVGVGKPSHAPIPLSGTAPWGTAAALMALPAALGSWLPGVLTLERALTRSAILYDGLLTFFAIDLALLFGFLFFQPQVVGRLWARWNPGIDETGVVVAARALLPRALALTVGVVVGAPLVLLLLALSRNALPIGASVDVLLMIAFVATDIIDELSARQRLGVMVRVRDVQRTAEVEPILFALKEKGIESFAQSFCFRITEQFFGPYVPVGILVPAAREAEARALLNGR
jgi:hypothetical protein